MTELKLLSLDNLIAAVEASRKSVDVVSNVRLDKKYAQLEREHVQIVYVDAEELLGKLREML